MGFALRILIADDNQLVRRGIAGLLANEKDCEVCGEAADVREVTQKTSDLHPDLVLLDVSMPGTNGLDIARLLRKQSSTLRILMISQHDPQPLLPRSLEAGANGCLDKSRLATDLLPTIRNMFAA